MPQSPSLVSLERARDYAPGLADVALAQLISAASRTVERYCRRTFALADYDELVTGTGHESIFVATPPILRVKAVRTSPLAACWVQNSDGDAQAATVDVQPDRLLLTKVKNGSTVETPLPWTSYPTFNVLVAAINLLGSGWSAELAERFAGWATADLRPEIGSVSARQLTTPLQVHWYYLSGFKVDEAAGEIVCPGGFPPGFQSVRVQYQGGYADTPDDLQQAVCELVQLAAAQQRLNPAMQSETLDRYSYSRAAESSLNLLSWSARQALNSYRVHRVARYSTE